MSEVSDDGGRVKVTSVDLKAARPFLDRFLDGSSFSDDRLELATAFARHRLSTDDGFVRVPREPTEAMLNACGEGVARQWAPGVWATMIAAVGEAA